MFQNTEPTQTEHNKHQSSLNPQHNTASDVEKMIRQLSLATAVGIDGIAPRVLKAAINPLSIIISKLIKKSIDSCVFADELKIARVSPIFKDGDSTDPGNYRPISMLPSVSELYERVVHQQLSNYLSK